MSDREPREQPEGVRILGAEEAQAELEGEQGRTSDRGGRAESPRRDATWSAAEQGEVPIDLDDDADRPVFPRPVQPDMPVEPDDLVRAVPVEPNEAPPLQPWT